MRKCESPARISRKPTTQPPEKGGCVIRLRSVGRGVQYRHMETLDILLGGAHRVKILRLFVFNEGDTFELKDIARRTRTTISSTRKETAMMEKVGLLKRRVFFTSMTRRGKKGKTAKKKARGFTLNPKFKYLTALRTFLLTAAPIQHNEIVKRLNTTGRCKLIVIAGTFIQDVNGNVDLLIVGDNISEPRLERAVRDIEAKLGRELRYANFSTHDFAYRMNIYDKLLRDIFDYPHQTLLNRLGREYNGGDIPQ